MSREQFILVYDILSGALEDLDAEDSPETLAKAELLRPIVAKMTEKLCSEAC